jgi:polar amino acid transport system substrate-binding protein
MFKLFVFILYFAVFSCVAEQATTRVLVKYYHEQKLVVLPGEKTELGYRFNPISNQIVNLATLDWPPYIGESLCNKGWVFQYTVALLVSKGYQVVVNFYPWARAVKLVESGQADILFPEYFIEANAPSDVYDGMKRRDLLALSESFPGGEIGFMKRKGEQDQFKGDLRNLVNERIGVVRGYQNTPEFDQMMDAKQFDILSAVTDFQLMKLLVAKRVNLIIGDPTVLRYSVEYSELGDDEKLNILDNVEQVQPNLQYNYLYFALNKKRPFWQDLMQDLNMAIREFEKQGMTQSIIDTNYQCAIEQIE